MVETHDVRLAGEGPAVEAVAAALGDVDAAPTRTDVADLPGADLGVAVGRVGGEVLPATTAATAAGTPVVAVEVGGVGGHRVAGVDAAVLGLSSAGACYDCVRTRVAAAEPETTGDEHPDPPTERLVGATAGQAAAARVRGEHTPVFPRTPDGDPLGGVVEVPHATRRVLPVPDCSCDDGERFAGLAPTDTNEVELAAAVERAETALDRRVGPVAEIGEVESFPVPYYMARLSATEQFSDASARRRAAGVDPDWNRALMRALGESLERYAAAVYRTTDLHRAPPSTVQNAVGPGEFVRPDDARAVDPTEPIEWVVGVDLAARLSDDAANAEDLVYLPAEAALFPPPTERYLRPVTTGLGLGTDPAGAVRSGLTEVIERDAAMLSWYSTFEPLGLAVDDDGYETLVRRARSENLSVTALLVTVDVDVPVVVAAVHRENEWPRLAVGTDAALDPATAAREALTEALQNWTELRSMGREAAGEEPTAIARYAEDPGPARRLLDADRVPAESVADPPPEERALSTLVERVTDAGLQPYAVGLTPRDVERAGFTAVRVVVPGAQPLFVDVDRPVFGERAAEVPTELGFEPRPDGPAHPFP